MVFRFFSPSRTRSRTIPAETPQGQRVYAVGDIHGRHDLLEQLLAKITEDDQSRDPCETSLIFLGDLIDRGPASAQVVSSLRQLSEERPNTRFLLGNHEEVMLKAMAGDLKALAFFCKIGGRETIMSYGVSEDEYRDSDYEGLLALLKILVPQSHVDFLSSFEDLIVIGDYAFVHAGIRPSEPLAQQKHSNLRWIRDEFLNYRGPSLEKVIVHGHTVSEEVEQKSFRIGLDTGAYASGKLSAMGFQGSERWLIQSSL